MQSVKINTMLNSVTGTGAGASAGLSTHSRRAFQATVVGTGAVTATVVVEVSANNINWLTMGTITLSGTTSASDGFGAETPWAYYRGNVTAISGTGAAVTLICVDA